MDGTRTRRQRAIRASDLARLVVCEQKAAFEDRYGERQDARSARNIDEGNRQHTAFLRQAFLVNPSVKSSEAKPWFFLPLFLQWCDSYSRGSPFTFETIATMKTGSKSPYDAKNAEDFAAMTRRIHAAFTRLRGDVVAQTDARQTCHSCALERTVSTL